MSYTNLFFFNLLVSKTLFLVFVSSGSGSGRTSADLSPADFPSSCNTLIAYGSVDSEGLDASLATHGAKGSMRRLHLSDLHNSDIPFIEENNSEAVDLEDLESSTLTPSLKRCSANQTKGLKADTTPEIVHDIKAGPESLGSSLKKPPPTETHL
jgi:hypothetical protein